MYKICKKCQVEFEVTEEDLRFYDKVSPVFCSKKFQMLAPTKCPDCRQQCRLSFRNERHLYHRKCDSTGENIISMYSPDKPYKVFEQSAWWGDDWNPLDYGRDFDFNRNFFEQFYELQVQVPRPALYSKNAENSQYTNHCDHAKNCYMTVDTGFCEDVFYSKWMINCKDCIDSYQLEKCELCYESLYSVASYHCSYIFLSDNCSNSSFLYDCNGCDNCFMCTHLRNKKYYIRNKEYTKDEYFAYMESLELTSYQNFIKCIDEYKDMKKNTFHKSPEGTNCINCDGDYLYNCKNVQDSFDVIESEDCKYCYDAGHMKDCYDAYEPAFDCELQYDCHACNRTKKSCFCNLCYDNYGLYYCDNCNNCQDCFGCVSLKHKRYCILNKQYTKEEYEVLVSKILEHMEKTKEFGEFFPVTISPFAYNETVANEYYPMTKEEVLEQGYFWKETDEVKTRFIASEQENKSVFKIPDHISDIKDDICDAILQCEVSKKNYKIIPQELVFYRKMDLPIPHKCSDQRHLERMELRNPRKLVKRSCDKCSKLVRSTYNPEEIVYCDECYMKGVY